MAIKTGNGEAESIDSVIEFIDRQKLVYWESIDCIAITLAFYVLHILIIDLRVLPDIGLSPTHIRTLAGIRYHDAIDQASSSPIGSSPDYCLQDLAGSCLTSA